MAWDLTAAEPATALPPGLSGGGEPAPRLRSNLELIPGSPERDGTPVFMIYDPVAARYFRIDARTADLLPLIDGRSADQLADSARQRLGHAISAEEVDGFFAFLRANDLVRIDAAQRLRHDARRAGLPGFWTIAAKTYISFRIPLFRPDRFLTRTIGHVAWLASTPMLLVHVLAALTGLFLVSRQFDIFLNTFVGFISFEGAAGFAVALTLVKAVHELGHAYAAKARGLRVPVIGAAFIVFWPILYTDTTDAWRLPRKRDRLTIGAAGVGVELAVAAWALLLWNLFPEKPVGSILFLLATSTWILSLLVNLNPLMRFDGYYLFTDLIGEANLESRANALGRWWFREAVFGFRDAPPEPPRLLLIGFAYAIWVYRFLLFLGIALIVYHMFFKALGIALFALEMYYFILAPVVRELRAWWTMRRRVALNMNCLRSLFLVALFGAWLFVPWQGSVSAPALLDRSYTTIYAPLAAQVEAVSVHLGERVSADAPLMLLRSPALDYEIAQAELKQRELAWERAAVGVDPLRQSRGMVIASELTTQERVVLSKRSQAERLIVRAPGAGTIVDMNQTLRPKGWIAEEEPLLAIVGPDTRVTAYLDERSLARIDVGAVATFYPADGVFAPLPMRVTGIATVGVQEIDEAYLRSQDGGPIQTVEQPDGGFVPVEATYRVTLEPDGAAAADNPQRGSVVIESRRESQYSKLQRRVLSLLYRESSF